MAGAYVTFTFTAPVKLTGFDKRVAFVAGLEVFTRPATNATRFSKPLQDRGQR